MNKYPAKEPAPNGLNPWSDLLDREEHQKAFHAGHSMDSKKVTEALGFLDMKQICYCLAHALMKHIDFGKGFYFLMDLQQYAKMIVEDSPNQKLNESDGSHKK